MTELKVQRRTEIGKVVRRLRRQGLIPAVLYGHGVTNVNLAVPFHQFAKAFKAAAHSSLVDLVVDGGSPVKVLIADVQANPQSGQTAHVDFRQVKMSEKLHTQIPLRFAGEPPAVKAFGGVLVTNLQALPVSCLPQDLVPEIVVDVTKLANLHDSLQIKDLALPNGVEVLLKLEEIVVTVIPPRSEEELAQLEAKPEAKVEAVEVVGKKPKEEGAAEGEAPAAAAAAPSKDKAAK